MCVHTHVCIQFGITVVLFFVCGKSGIGFDLRERRNADASFPGIDNHSDTYMYMYAGGEIKLRS